MLHGSGHLVLVALAGDVAPLVPFVDEMSQCVEHATSQSSLIQTHHRSSRSHVKEALLIDVLQQLWTLCARLPHLMKFADDAKGALVSCSKRLETRSTTLGPPTGSSLNRREIFFTAELLSSAALVTTSDISFITLPTADHRASDRTPDGVWSNSTSHRTHYIRSTN